MHLFSCNKECKVEGTDETWNFYKIAWRMPKIRTNPDTGSPGEFVSR